MWQAEREVKFEEYCPMMDAVAATMFALLICVVIAIIVSARFMVGKHQIPVNHCWHCGYDLTSLDDGAVCPECGERSK